MDKKIKKIEAINKREGVQLRRLMKADKKRDKVCEAGSKMIKKK